MLIPGVTAAAVRAGGSCATSQLQQVSGGSTSLAGSVPVVFIHGIISKPQMWKPSSPRSIAYQAARISGITAWTFNYQPEALDWVTNPAIGPAFADRLACLAHASGNKVIVVAHSMGGLATQYALAQPDRYGGAVGNHVAELITVATPYQGSELLSAMQAARSGVDLSESGILAEALLSACAGHTSGICALPAVLPSQVGTDLELNSAAIAQLPPWPARLPVLDIAGDMGLLIGIDHIFVLHRFDVGDVAVTVGSATAHNTTSTPLIKHCNSLKLLGAIYGNPGPCFHNHLVNDGDIITEVLAAIQATVQLAAPAKVYLRTAPTQGIQSGFRAYKPPCDVAESCPLVLVPASGSSASGLISITGTQWSSWTSTEATGTGTLSLTSTSLPVRVTLSQPVHACGHYYWSTAEFTILASNPLPTGHQDLFNAVLAIGNVNDQPCPA
jgi:pimeloyl-ACP methyl ester carboxylesterase